MGHYEEIRNEYNNLRNSERIKLRDFLADKEGVTVSKHWRSGKGIKDYTSGHRLLKEYDLSNWLYIEGKIYDVNFFVSFQAFDIDPNSFNIHTLKDRIGIAFYTGDYTFEKVLDNMKITNYELPLSEKDMNEIYVMIKNIARKYKELSDLYDKYNLV